MQTYAQFGSWAVFDRGAGFLNYSLVLFVGTGIDANNVVRLKH
jgi:hypothetical protein